MRGDAFRERMNSERYAAGYVWGRQDAGDRRLPDVEDAARFARFFADTGCDVSQIKHQYEAFCANEIKGTQ